MHHPHEYELATFAKLASNLFGGVGDFLVMRLNHSWAQPFVPGYIVGWKETPVCIIKNTS
jgi:hypothetical protein